MTSSGDNTAEVTARRPAAEGRCRTKTKHLTVGRSQSTDQCQAVEGCVRIPLPSLHSLEATGFASPTALPSLRMGRSRALPCGPCGDAEERGAYGIRTTPQVGGFLSLRWHRDRHRASGSTAALTEKAAPLDARPDAPRGASMAHQPPKRLRTRSIAPTKKMP